MIRVTLPTRGLVAVAVSHLVRFGLLTWRVAFSGAHSVSMQSGSKIFGAGGWIRLSPKRNSRLIFFDCLAKALLVPSLKLLPTSTKVLSNPAGSCPVRKLEPDMPPAIRLKYRKDIAASLLRGVSHHLRLHVALTRLKSNLLICHKL